MSGIARKLMSAAGAAGGIRFVGSTSNDSRLDGNSITLGLSKPSGVSDGTLMLAFIHAAIQGKQGSDVAATIADATGWTRVYNETRIGAVEVFYRVHTGDGLDESPYTFGASGSGVDIAISGVLAAYDDAEFDLASAAVNTTTTAGSVSLSSGNSTLLAAFSAGRGSRSTAQSSIASATAGLSLLDSSPNAVDSVVSLWSQNNVPAGATGDKTATPSGTWELPRSFLVGLKPK